MTPEQMLAGAGIAGAYGLGNTFLSFGLGQKAASRSWDKWKDAQVRGPSLRVAGLRAAGLNPILAAKGGLGGTGGGASPMPALASGGQHSARAQDLLLSAQADQMIASAEASRATAAAATANARVLGARATALEGDPNLMRDILLREGQPTTTGGIITQEGKKLREAAGVPTLREARQAADVIGPDATRSQSKRIDRARSKGFARQRVYTAEELRKMSPARRRALRRKVRGDKYGP